MKILFKHLLRSILQKPLQPLILVLVISLAVATCAFSFTLYDTLLEEVEAAQEAKYGSADFTVSLSNSSASRFLFADDVQDVLGDSCNVVGCYEMPFILSGTGETARGVATDLSAVDGVFSLAFSSYGKVTNGALASSCFVSETFASAHGLSVGDTLAVETLGKTKSYRVEGIATLPFLGSFDVMVDTSGIVRALAESSMLFAAIGDSFRPCNTVYVDVLEGGEKELEQAVELLADDPRFEGKKFTNVRNLEKREARLTSMEVVIGVCVGLCALLCAVVVFCCFYVLSSERTEENLALVYAGASPPLLSLIQYAETILYWLLGSFLGTLTAIPLAQTISRFVGLRYAQVSITPFAVFKSVALLLGVCMLTVALFIALGKRTRRVGLQHSSHSFKPVLGLLFALLFLLLLLFLLPGKFRFDMYIVTVAVLVAFLLVAVPRMLVHIATAIVEKMAGAKQNGGTALIYALKNLSSLKLLHNIARLSALSVTIVLTVAFVFVCLKCKTTTLASVFDADYAVLNATDSCYEKTVACDGVASANRFYLMQTQLATMVSAQDIDAYSDKLKVERLPVGNEVVLSRGVAEMTSARVGDEIETNIGGLEYHLVVCDVVDVGTNYAAINCEDLGISYNMILVKGEEGVSNDSLLAALSDATSTELAPIVTADTLLSGMIESIETYIRAGGFLLAVSSLFYVVGMGNTLHESFRSRRGEFELYRLAGMQRRTLRKMKCAEVAVAMLFGTIIGIAAFLFASIATAKGMTNYGTEILLDLMDYI